MRRHSIKLCTLTSAFAASLAAVAAAQPAKTSASHPGVQEYCNAQYMYCVALPDSGKVQPHEGDAPNHGVTIKLPEPGGVAWTYAHWDAALLASPQKAALGQLEVVLNKHPNAEVNMKPTVVAGLPAYRIRLTYADIRPTIEEVIVAYRRPKDEPQGPGIIYEIGLNSSQIGYSVNVSTLDALARSFRQTRE
jgi:hypothetical protein